MPAHFEEDGVRFQYPENWEIERQDTDSGWTVTVQSPAAAFFMLSHDAEMPDTESMADTALEALRSVYPVLDAEAAVDSLAGQPAVGYDVRFFSLDLTNTCWLRSFCGAAGTVLVMWEANDLELDRLGPVLQAIAASIVVDEDAV
jgi:hypothetical protein